MKSERWLIAVNGKTEEIYVNALRQRFRSSAVEAKVFAKDPLKQVEETETFAKRESTKFSRVYVVFDTDSFGHVVTDARKKIYDLDARARLKPKKPGCSWHATVSVPCFELWYLLHFQYTTAAFGVNTPCDDLRNQFAELFKSYSRVDLKAAKAFVETKLTMACENAERLASDLSTSKTTCGF